MAPIERGWLELIVDKLTAWWVGLAGETTSYTVERLTIPIAELSLAANLYRPKISSPHGTILIRTSYGIGPMMALGHARLFASRGYQVLLAACRGTDPSDGQEVIIGVHEEEDGLATVSWMRNQPWYTGSFATFGGSYLGYTQWALLANPPEDMKAAVIMTGPVDFGDFAWGTGAMDSHIISWADLMTAPKRGVKPSMSYVKQQPKALRPVYDSVPLVDGINRHFQNDPPAWLVDVITDSNFTKPIWKTLNKRTALDKADLPILQFTGWNDALLPSVTRQYEALVERGVAASLVVGPWSHLGAQRGPAIVEGFKYIEHHLAGRGENPFSSPCRVHVNRIKEWRNLSHWPPASNSSHELYLSPDQALSTQQPDEDDSVTAFTFDPEEPTPNIGMGRPFDDVIPANYEDMALTQRADVAVFTSQPFDTDITILGRPSIELHHSSDNPHVDVLVQLSEVDSKDKSMRISDVYRRLDPSRGPDPLVLALSDCAHVFRKGSRIRVLITGGAHPAYIRNLGTGENQGTGATTRPATHSVHHSANRASVLRLPVTN